MGFGLGSILELLSLNEQDPIYYDLNGSATSDAACLPLHPPPLPSCRRPWSRHTPACCPGSWGPASAGPRPPAPRAPSSAHPAAPRLFISKLPLHSCHGHYIVSFPHSIILQLYCTHIPLS